MMMKKNIIVHFNKSGEKLCKSLYPEKSSEDVKIQRLQQSM